MNDLALRIWKRKFIEQTMKELQQGLTDFFEKDLGYGAKRMNDAVGKLNKRLPEHLQLERGRGSAGLNK